MSFEIKVQKAIFSALTALSIPVFDEVPQDQSFDYAVIGDSDYDEFDTDTSIGAEGKVSITVWSRYRGRKAIKEVQNEIYQLLQRAQLAIVGYNLITLDFISSDTTTSSDGKTREGEQIFNIIIDEG